MGDVTPRPPNPLAAPEDAGGGPRDCRVSLAALELDMVGVAGAGEGEGDRCGLSVCDAILPITARKFGVYEKERKREGRLLVKRGDDRY